MEQILKLILTNSQPIALILSLAILGIVAIGILYLRKSSKTIQKAATNDYHTVPDDICELKDAIKEFKAESNLAHNLTNQLLSEIKGRLSK